MMYTFSEPSPRVRRIRQRVRSTKPELCSERARLVTEAYKETEGEASVIRRAKALDKILRGMSIHIGEDQLLVGDQASKPKGGVLFPEVAVDWIQKDLDTFETREQDPFIVPEEVRGELLEIFPYWKGKTVRDKFYKRVPEHAKSALDAKVIKVKDSGGIGHQLINTPEILSKGFEGIKKEIEAKIKSVDLTKPGSFQKWTFWKALIITCDAVIAFSNRYSQEARKLASQQADEERRKELEKIAEICERVPAQPAKTFHEALQVVSLLTVVTQISQNGTGITIGRLDQHLYPYYRKDIEDGRISNQEAQELLDCLWLKLQELNIVRGTDAVPIWPGYEMGNSITVGGQTKNGTDATNELTYMCLEAAAHVHMRRPQFVLRIHKDSPDEVIKKAIEVMKLGGGRPELLSDKTNIQALKELGVPLHEARDYAPIGCAEPVVMGARMLLRWSWISLPKILELALNNGVDPRTGEKVGPSTGDPSGFTCYGDMVGAFNKQLEYFFSLTVSLVTGLAEPLVAEEMPHPLFSAITPDCIERGLDITAGGAKYDWSGVWIIGPATVGDSLTAIKSLVFEEKKMTMGQLKEALDSNFNGREAIRQMLLHAPKYGNDDDYADSITKKVMEKVYDELEQYRTARGGRFTAGYISVGINVAFGKFVGATPDGRKAWTPLSDGMSPVQGKEMNGPTASLKSVSKLDLVRAGGGGILNQKINPSLLEKERDIHCFSDLIKTFLNDLGGLQVQFNIVSSETLKDAQKHPENYQDLLIRVVGYSAYFNELSRKVQDDIIARSEHDKGN